MSCNNYNRSTSPAYGTANVRNNQAYRGSQPNRNQQMYRQNSVHRNVANGPASSRISPNCGGNNEQSQDYRHSSCECSDNSCNQASAPVDSMMVTMAYVPWQQWGEIFDYEKALMCGTIFEDLSKPWTGRACN